MTPRCHDCDLPLATDEDYDTIAEGDGMHLCWRKWSSDICPRPGVNWRERALAAEAELRALRQKQKRQQS